MKLSRKHIALAIVCIIVVIFLARLRGHNAYETARIERGQVVVWSVYVGTIESQNVRNLASTIRGSATITEIVPDGTSVTQGMPVAQFDASRWEDDILESKKDLLLAKADYDSLINAKLPLEIRELESKVIKARQILSDQQQALKDTRELYAEELVPEYEVKQIEVKLSTTEAEIEGFLITKELTETYLHPAALRRAQASLDSASNAYINTQRKIEASIARSPADGIAVLKQTNIAGDFRAARIGDTLWHSQVFMTISDMNDLVARCDVPESELTRVTPGALAVIRPIAYPDMELHGKIIAVGSMAQHLPGHSDGSKFFEVVVKVDSESQNLRSDMSAEIHILSHKADDALLIPRAAVWWEQGKSYCYTVSLGRKKRKLITLGIADGTRFELLDGLEPGQKVIVK